jgi:signal transduction histidine kinase
VTDGYVHKVEVHARGMIEQLSAAVLAVTRHLSVQEVLQTIVASARSLVDCEYAALGVPDDAGAFAEFVVDGVSDEQRAAIGPLPRQHGLLAVMLHEAKPQRLDDVRRDPRFGWWPAAHPVLKDFLGVPVVDGDEILGAIYLANSRAGRFTEDDERLVGVLAAHAAIALTNAQLYERSRELAMLTERHRIARELHDAVAQTLFSLRLTADAAAALVHRDPGRAAAELHEVTALAAQATTDLRHVVAELRPPDLAEQGLVETLRGRIALLDRVQTATVSFTTQGVPRLSARVEETVLRVAEEALHNALRHARAHRVDVTLTTDDDAVMLEIADDGMGLATADASEGGVSHLGLASMRDRARSVGGQLQVAEATTGGTLIRLVVPHD